MIVYPNGKTANDYNVGDFPNYRSDDYYNTSHSLIEIERYLQRVKDCVRKNRFIVLDDGESRSKNADFLFVYGLYSLDEQRRSLLSLCAEDFCHSVNSSDGRSLFVFCVKRELYKSAAGERQGVWIYIKHDCQPATQPYDVVISMHELEMPVDLLFVD